MSSETVLLLKAGGSAWMGDPAKLDSAISGSWTLPRNDVVTFVFESIAHKPVAEIPKASRVPRYLQLRVSGEELHAMGLLGGLVIFRKESDSVQKRGVARPL